MQPSHDIFCSKYTKSKKFSKIIVACQMTFIYLYLFSWSYRCTISKLESLLWLQQNPLTCLLDSVSKLMGIFVLPFKFGIQWRLLSKLTEIKVSEAYWTTQRHVLPCCEGSFGLVMMSMLFNCRNVDTISTEKTIPLYLVMVQAQVSPPETVSSSLQEIKTLSISVWRLDASSMSPNFWYLLIRQL